MSIATKAATLAVLATAAGASAAAPVAITPGDLVIYRAGNGTETLSNTGNSVFVDEYTTAGVLVQSIALPSAAASNNLVASGTASSEGLLTVSPNGKFVALTGYNRAVGGTGSLSGTTATAVPRTVGIIPVATGVPDTSTSLTDFATSNNPRSAVTTDGNGIYVTGGAGGVRYTTIGSTTSTALTTATNLRQVNVFSGQLYGSSNSTAGTPANATSIGSIGTGLPTTAGQAFTSLPGLEGVTGSKYAFFLADLSAGVAGLDTLYIADDGAPALSKYSLVGGTWTLNGTIGTTTDNYAGLTGSVSGTTVSLFATANGTSLVGLTDASGYNGAFAGTPTTLATPGTSQVFLGVGFVPVAAALPEPAGLAVLGIIGLGALRRRRV